MSVMGATNWWAKEYLCLRTSRRRDDVDFFLTENVPSPVSGTLGQASLLYVIYAIYLNLSRRFASAHVNSLLCLLPIHLFTALY